MNDTKSAIPRPVFRFAPSPNGALHLGHAYSALLNFRMARAIDGKFLLRIEDIDLARCKPEFEAQMLRDLEWLGVEWDEEPRRQSQHLESYREALDVLEEEHLIYPAFMSRSEIRDTVHGKGKAWPQDPDGVPHYPATERNWSAEEVEDAKQHKPAHARRLNMAAAIAHAPDGLVWIETGEQPHGEWLAQPEKWGDTVLARADTPTSYHLAVTLDDALQGITHVVRGRDLLYATSVHRLLQSLLGLPAPIYHHHDLIMGDDGRKLSKSAGDTALATLRDGGATPEDIVRLIGLDRPEN